MDETNTHIPQVGGHQVISVELAPGHAGWRLDRALADAVPTLSRERLKSLIRRTLSHPVLSDLRLWYEPYI